MSGTSLDGVDAALVEIAGSGEGTQIQLKRFVSVPFAQEVQTELLRVASQTPVAAQVRRVVTASSLRAWAFMGLDLRVLVVRVETAEDDQGILGLSQG